MAKKYFGVNTLEALIDLIKVDLGGKVSADQIANMLTSAEIVRDLDSYVAGEPEDNKIVAAKIVKEIKDTLTSVKGSVDTLVGDGAGAAVTVDDMVTDWGAYSEGTDANKVVAASLIKAIKDLVDTINGTVTTLDGELETLNTTVTGLNESVTNLQSSKGAANGIASLDSNGKVPAEQLPSYVDDVIEGYLVVSGDAPDQTYTFYEPDEQGTAASATVIPGEKGKIYIDLTSSKSYRWSGSTYTEVSGSEDMVEITATEVEEIWNEVLQESAGGQ